MIRPPPRPTLFPYTTLSRPPLLARRDDLDVKTAQLRQQVEDGRAAVDRRARDAKLWREYTAGLKRDADRKSTRLNSSHANISYAVFCLKKKNFRHARTTIIT